MARHMPNRAMNESDLLIMVGASVADRAVSQPDLDYTEQGVGTYRCRSRRDR
ncbi:MAG: hypothetical protein ACLR6I_09075 [Waltera sp.]